MDQRRSIDDLINEGFDVIEWTDEPNTTYAAHEHPDAEVRVVLAGTMTVTIGAEVQTLRAGDRLDIEPGQVHSATIGPDGARYLAGRAR